MNNEIDMMKERDEESALANLASNIFHELIPDADFVLLNPGLFRTEWVPGLIQYQHFYNMFPFENEIQTFSIMGKELL